MLTRFLQYSKINNIYSRHCSSVKENVQETKSKEYETVFSFPFVKYISVLNRLKIYQIIGTSIAIPSCGLLEIMNTVPSGSCLSAAYIGLTGTATLSLASWPFKNVIGFLYISKDNEEIKISAMDFWGKRIDRIVSADDWIPLFDLSPRKMDIIYLSPQLSDGTKYKLFLKFGNVLNSKKMGEVLE